MFKIGDEVIIKDRYSRYHGQKGIIKEYGNDFDYVVQIEGVKVLFDRHDIALVKNEKG